MRWMQMVPSWQDPNSDLFQIVSRLSRIRAPFGLAPVTVFFFFFFRGPRLKYIYIIFRGKYIEEHPVFSSQPPGHLAPLSLSARCSSSSWRLLAGLRRLLSLILDFHQPPMRVGARRLRLGNAHPHPMRPPALARRPWRNLWRGKLRGSCLAPAQPSAGLSGCPSGPPPPPPRRAMSPSTRQR
jgi:hypothetical protein